MRAASLLVLSAVLLTLPGTGPASGRAAEPGTLETIAGPAEPEAADAALDDADAKLDTRLRATPGPVTSAGGVRPGPRGTPSWQRDGRVRVTVRLDRLDRDARQALRAAGLAIERESPGRGLVEGWVEPTMLRTVAALDRVRNVRPVDRGYTRVGRFATGGDSAARANLARALGLNGAGVRVGVISDGIDGVATSQGTADLPAVSVPPGCSAGGGSEGRAMLEIVHDLAPGAELMFASGIDSPMVFVEAVQCLTAAGAQVIVDDLGFFGEPYFEDGMIAQAVRAAVQAGVSYHSAAGNGALTHYEGEFRPARQTSRHDFDPGPGVDDTNGVAIAPGGSLLCVLQWDDPFGGAGDDYNLLLLDQRGQRITASTNMQRGTDDPLEIVVARNDGGGREVVGLAIERTRRAAPRTLELFCVRDTEELEYVTAGSSIFGHAGIPEAVAVGAIDVDDPGLDTVERFSSRGPARIVFPQPATRAKPDLAAFDGVTTGVPGFAPFFGTSAAAPHVAAVAALMLERNPFLLPAEVQAILAATAVDIGPAGFDNDAGAGRVDALAAVNAVAPPECTADTDCADDDPCTADGCTRGRCTRDPAACDDGDPCNGIETCQPGAGGCVAGVAAPDGTPCPDGTVCNGDETCAGGACQAGIALTCGDGDTCTQDVCSPEAGCQFPALEGLASVSCVLDRGLPSCPGVELPAAVSRRFAKARRLVILGEGARWPPKQRRLIRRAARVLRQAVRAVDRAAGRLPAECANSLADSLGDARDRARAAAQSLR